VRQSLARHLIHSRVANDTKSLIKDVNNPNGWRIESGKAVIVREAVIVAVSARTMSRECVNRSRRQRDFSSLSDERNDESQVGIVEAEGKLARVAQSEL
jgi:hypothetical protein